MFKIFESQCLVLEISGEHHDLSQEITADPVFRLRGISLLPDSRAGAFGLWLLVAAVGEASAGAAKSSYGSTSGGRSSI